MKLTIRQLQRLTKEQSRKYHKNDRCSHRIGYNGTCRMCGLEGVMDKNTSWDHHEQ